LLKIPLASRNKTFTLNEIEFHELEAFTENNKRYYMTPTGEKYPSVTTVLGSRDKSWLYEWRKKVGEEEANRISQRASNRGTRLHKICEDYIRNKEDFCDKQPPLAVDMFRSIQRYVDYIDEVYGNEIAIYSHELKTAG